jgi:hypothetical protein
VTGSTVFSTNTTDKLHERASAPYARMVAVVDARLAVTLEVAGKSLGNWRAGTTGGTARWREWRAELGR